MISRTFVIAGLLLLAAVSLVALVGCPKQQGADAPPMMEPPMPDPAAGMPAEAGATIRQIGSTTVLPLAEKWHTAFQAANPGANIAVSGGGSGAGIEALTNGTAEIAMSSRDIKDKEIAAAQEKGITPVEHTVAYDGIAVIVNPACGVESLSVEQLSDIFVGTIKNWKDVGGTDGEIVLISRDSASGTYEAFKELVIQLHGKDKERDYSAEALKESSNQAVLTAVAQTKTAIGYVGLGYLDASVKALKVIPVGGGHAVEPTVDNVKSGAYPISRALHYYTNGDPSGALKDYIDFCLSPEGQKIVADEGFVPVN